MAKDFEDVKPILRNEKNNSIGFDDEQGSQEIQSERAKALEYIKGEMRDLPRLHNRSGYVSYDVADTIEAAVPALTEIFLQEDVVTFVPVSSDDEEAAKIETDYVKHVVFQENNGFQIFQDAIRDALQVKTGYFVWEWEDGGEPKEEEFEDASYEDVQNALVSNPPDGPNQVVDLEIEKILPLYDAEGKEIEPEITDLEDFDQANSNIDPSRFVFSYKIRQKKPEGRVCVKTWAPNDVAVSEDTVCFGEGTYTGFRSRVRRQDLLEDGYDSDAVMEIPRDNILNTEVELARDQAGEHDRWYGGEQNPLLDMVWVYYEYIKVWDEDEDRNVLYYVVSGGNDHDVMLHMEETDCVPASAIVPYPNPHRFYGLSMADKLIPTQYVKTGVNRHMLDWLNYTLNQRHEVATSGIGEHTMKDLLNNWPGSPVRVERPGTVNPIQTAPMNFPIFDALEKFSTDGEMASGVARTGMGITPDTLHDTASGAIAMMSQQAVRTRFMARNFAETGVKKLFMGVHKMIRENSSVAKIARLSGKWVPVNPASWMLRENMEVEIGTTGGREYDMQNLSNILELQQAMAQGQGGMDGPLVGPQNILETAQAMTARAGFKNPDRFFKDPATVQPPQPQDPMQSPEALKVQAELQSRQQIEQAKIQAQMQKDQLDAQYNVAKLQADQANQDRQFQLEQAKAQFDAQMEVQKLLLEAEVAREKLRVEMGKTDGNLALKDKQIELEVELKRQIAALEAQLQALEIDNNNENQKLEILANQETAETQAVMSAQPTEISLTRVELGGDPG